MPWESQNDKAAHTGGTATYTEKAKCSTCGQAYGDYKKETGYTLRINGTITDGKEIDKGSNNVVYKAELKKSDKIIISKDGAALSGTDYSGAELTIPHNGTYTFYVNAKNEIYVRINLTIYTNGWAKGCDVYLYYWTTTGNSWEKISHLLIDEADYPEDNAGDKALVELPINISGMIVCEMNSDSSGWGNVKKQSGDCNYTTGTSVYKIYMP